MGETITSKCRDCGEEFLLSEGGGFCFDLLQCDTCCETLQWDRRNGTVFTLEDDGMKPISEKPIPQCKCGGTFKTDAPPRCPKCRSTKIDKGKSDSGEIQHICYD